MLKIEKKDIRFNSADGEHKVAATSYKPLGPVFCVLQIAHGLCEHKGRYEQFARFMAQSGVAVYINDHLGHGKTAAKKEYGYFGQHGSREFVLQDLKQMHDIAKEVFPGVPQVLLGHSMGSFFARAFVVRWPQELNGLILSGTTGQSPFLGFGLSAASVLEKSHGIQHRSKFLQRLTFGSYLGRIKKAKTRFDWLSTDEEVVRRYILDSQCNFLFTVGGYYELFHILQEVSGPAWANAMPKSLPIFLFAGTEDPVGNYGKGVQQVEAWLNQAGVGPLFSKLYPNARHEVLNETVKEEAYKDVLFFLKACCEVSSGTQSDTA